MVAFLQHLVIVFSNAIAVVRCDNHDVRTIPLFITLVQEEAWEGMIAAHSGGETHIGKTSLASSCITRLSTILYELSGNLLMNRIS